MQNQNFVFGKKRKAWFAKKFAFPKSRFGNEAQSFIFKMCFWQKSMVRE
jgi:hypothetical protein